MATAARILVLEDDQEMRTILAQVLEDQGYEVVAVERGDLAVDQARRQPFDLIVADIRMEGMDGLEAVARTKEEQPEIGTLIVSGYASPEETTRARQLKVGGYLKKPFKMKEFLELVRGQLVRRHREERREQRGLSARDSLVWALRALCRVAGHSGSPQPAEFLTEAEELARTLAASARLSPDVCEEVGLAAPLALLQPLEAARPPEAFLHDPTLLPAMKTAVLHYRVPWNNEPRPPLEARVVAVALAAVMAGREPGEPLPSAGELAQRGSGILDPELLKVYRRVRENAEAASADQEGSAAAGSLLTLAQALERAGDRVSAERAYQEVVELSPTGREAIQALLGRARIARAAGAGPGELVNRAAEIGRHLGPVTSAITLLECGLLLYRSGDDGFRNMLREALTGLDRLGLKEASSRALIPLIRRGEAQERLGEVLQLVASPGHAHEVVETAPWLLGDLLELLSRSPSPADRVLYGLAGQFPTALGRLLVQGQLSAESRNFLVSVLEQAGGFVPGEVLEALLRDADPAIRQRAEGLRSRASSGRTVAPLLRVHSFGMFEVHLGDEGVDNTAWKTQKTRYLLAFLASEWGRSFHEDQILEHFWPKDREKGKKNLYWSTSVARRCLRREGSNIEVLERRGETLRLNPDIPHWHDLQELERSARQAGEAAAEGRSDLARGHYRRVAQLHRGGYMDGCYMDWAVRRRDSLEEMVTECLCRLASLSLEVGEGREAQESASAALEMQPHRQDAHLLLMRSLIDQGRPEEAIEQFRACEALLKRDYDLEPATELIEYYHRARLTLG